MKTKKSGIIAALSAAVLILIAILVTTCLEPVQPNGNPGGTKAFPQIPENFVPTPGKGLVQFIIADEVKGRVIYPDVVSGAGFEEFDLYIYNDDGAAAGTWDGTQTPYTDTNITSQPIRISKTELTGPLELPEAFYFFKLDAYQYDVGDSSPGAGVIAATGRSSAFEIEENAANEVPVTLLATGASKSGSGRFDYLFTFETTALEKADLTITSVTGGSGTGADDLTDNVGIENLTLLADYYRIRIDMEKTGFQPAFYMETLYIYEGMTTTAEKTIPALKNIAYTLSFTFGDGRASDPATESTTHGTTLATFLTANTAYTNPSHFNPASNLIFNGWYLDSADTNTPSLKISDTYVFIKDGLELFAGWTEGTSITFIPNYTPPSGNEPSITADLIYNPAQAAGSITFSIPSTGYTGISWATSVQGIIGGETGDTFILTIDNSTNGIKYKVLGEFTVTVFATHTGSGAPVDSTVTVSVEEAP